jgi:hypothetical protein
LWFFLHVIIVWFAKNPYLCKQDFLVRKYYAYKNMKKLSAILTIWLLFFCIFAQERGSPAQMQQKTPINRSTLVGIGSTFLRDTYLSPLPYDGTGMSILHDRIQGSRFFNERLLIQQQFQIQAATTSNPVGNAMQYYGNLSYHLNGLYPIFNISRFRLFIGGGLDASLGGIYNTRNSNNPGSAKASTNLNAAVMARYNLGIFTFRWQLSAPFAGAFFAPPFGKSYYEMFGLGNNSGLVHFGSLHNQQALRNYFTVDIPLRNITLRTGYLGSFYRTNVNSLITRISSHQFMIGLATETLNFGGRQSRDTPWLRSVFY